MWPSLSLSYYACEERHLGSFWPFFGIAFLWDWKENWPFLVLWPLLWWHLVPSLDGKHMGKQWKHDRLKMGDSKNHCRRWLQPSNSKTLAPWKKSYDQPRQHTKKQRHYFANKGPSSQAVVYGCESWTIKKAEHRRIDAFELWYWRRLLRVPWTARKSNQSILKEISPEYSLEGLMLKLKLQSFHHLM